MRNKNSKEGLRSLSRGRVLFSLSFLGWAFLQSAGGETWKRIALPVASQNAAYADINQDGKVDAIAGSSWFEGPAFTQKHNYTDLFTWGSYPYDFNGDGWIDLFVYTCACVGGEGYVLENPKRPDAPWKTTKVTSLVGGEQVLFRDLNGDGKPELLSTSDYHIGWWSFDPKEATKPWVFTAITPREYHYHTYMHGLGFGDVDGDGDFDILESDGWWEHPTNWDGKSPWKLHHLQFGEKNGIAHIVKTDLGVTHELYGASTLWTYDVDGDGDQDVVSAIDAHGWGLLWFEQTQTKTADGGPDFIRHWITGTRADYDAGKYPVAFSQAHFINLEDMNRDGLPDLVTGKRWHAHGANADPEPDAPAVTYWFELKRTAGTIQWIPHLMDDVTGIGVQFEVGDLNGDGYKDVVISSYKTSAVLLQQSPFPVTITPKLPFPNRGKRISFLPYAGASTEPKLWSWKTQTYGIDGRSQPDPIWFLNRERALRGRDTQNPP